MAYRNRRKTEIPDEETINSIIKGNDIEILVKCAENIGTGLARNERLKASGVRNFFGMVRKMEATEASEIEDKKSDNKKLSDETYRELLLLKPKLSYQAQREQGEGIATLSRVLIPAISAVGKDAKAFRNFVDFFEAILAYHKAAGGQDK